MTKLMLRCYSDVSDKLQFD